MRRKIAKRKRRECIRMGASIQHEGWVKEHGWKRKNIGYSVRATYDGWTYISAGDDELEAYNLLLWGLKTPNVSVSNNNEMRI